MKKIRVLFPYVEAGYGHIMPMKSIEQTFAGKYGDRVEVVSSRFFTETGKKPLIKYQKMMMDRVRTYNGHPFIGHFATLSCKVFGSFISSLCTIRIINPAAFREGVKHMRELKPDVVFSTHWATNYYAEQLKENKPATVMYCPDAQLNPLFEYHSD
ncbi:MAG: hypothetical protein J5766_02660, partial [Clostridia bacterium]|nr:hypothetical protein [Clostridia bacterium]